MQTAARGWLTVGMTSTARTNRIISSTAGFALAMAIGVGVLPAATAATADGTARSSAPASASASAAAGTRIATVKASKVTLTRTKTANAIRMSWPKVAGATHYNLFIIGSASEIATTTTRATSATVSDMKPHVRYTVIVTPMRSAKAQASMRAVMAKALDGSGAVATMTMTQATSAETTDSDVDVEIDTAPVISPQSPAQAPSAEPSSGGSSSAPSAPAAPKTKVIEVCPDGFVDTGSDCEQTISYTFHTETETRAYSYHSEKIGTESWQGTCDAVYTYWDGFSENVGHYSYPCTHYRDVFGDVKDATPAGFTDDGSAWVKHTQVKDTTPSGYCDNGSAWVTTAAKITKVVPA